MVNSIRVGGRRVSPVRAHRPDREARLEVLGRWTIGLGSANFALVALLTRLRTDNPAWVDAVVVVLAVVALVCAAVWIASRFWIPEPRALCFGLMADLGPLFVILTLRPVDALMACVLFAIVGAYFVFCLSRRWLIAHVAFACTAAIVLAVAAVIQGAPMIKIVLGLDTVLAVVLGTSMTVQVAWRTMRGRAELAGTDPLTQICNLRGMWREAETMLAASAHAGDVVVVAVADIDAFKRVNDTHGHDVGDEVLVTVAQTLDAHIGSSGLLARSGGEEFTMLARGSLDAVRTLVASIPTSFPAAGGGPSVTMSIGTALVEPDRRVTGREATDDARRRADRVMYEVKRSGGNAVGVAF